MLPFTLQLKLFIANQIRMMSHKLPEVCHRKDGDQVMFSQKTGQMIKAEAISHFTACLGWLRFFMPFRILS